MQTFSQDFRSLSWSNISNLPKVAYASLKSNQYYYKQDNGWKDDLQLD